MTVTISLSCPVRVATLSWTDCALTWNTLGTRSISISAATQKWLIPGLFQSVAKFGMTLLQVMFPNWLNNIPPVILMQHCNPMERLHLLSFSVPKWFCISRLYSFGLCAGIFCNGVHDEIFCSVFGSRRLEVQKLWMVSKPVGSVRYGRPALFDMIGRSCYGQSFILVMTGSSNCRLFQPIGTDAIPSNLTIALFNPYV